MSKAFIDDTNLTNIANSIRSKLGVSDTYLPSEMAGAVLSIPKRKVVDFNVSPITLNGAMVNSLQYVKTYGGTEQRNLPLGYQELEYIESTGTQYIDTGIVQQDNDEFNLVYQVVTLDSSYRNIVGASSDGTAGTFYISQQSGATFVGNASNSTPTYPRNYSKHTLNWIVSPTLPNNLNLDNTNYSFNIGITANPSLSVKIFARNSNQDKMIGKIYSYYHKHNNQLLINLIPCKNSSGVIGMYDTVSHQFLTNAGTGDFIAGPHITTYPIPTPTSPVDIVCNNGILKVDGNGNVYTQGNQETIQLGTDIATCERLLSLNGYTDTQEILNGIVTRKIGIKVLDGSEDWELQNASRSVFVIKTLYPADFASNPDNNVGLCSHFEVTARSTTVSSIMSDGQLAWNTAAYLMMRHVSSAGDVPTFKQWLANQYANGTPVIIVYPLATPTTEIVTAQSMQTVAGDNTLEITQSSLPNLEVECEYFIQ